MDVALEKENFDTIQLISEKHLMFLPFVDILFKYVNLKKKIPPQCAPTQQWYSNRSSIFFFSSTSSHLLRLLM